MCYYSSWAYVRPGNGNFDVENIDPQVCTHLIYAFIGVNWDGTVRVMDPWNDLEEDWGKGIRHRFLK
jgi:chitinase